MMLFWTKCNHFQSNIKYIFRTIKLISPNRYSLYADWIVLELSRGPLGYSKLN